MPSFADSSVLVAGGTGGLGRAIALAFLAEGAHVTVTYVTPAEYDALRAAAGESAARLEGHGLDVTDESAARALVAESAGDAGVSTSS